MAKDGAVYVCQSCGSVQGKWSGQCPACSAWNTMVEEVQARPPGALAAPRSGRAQRGLAFETLEAATPAPPRIQTGVAEFDRVCGGGVVPGSALLLGGDPGVGKSTLLMQVMGQASQRGTRCAYISGEEAVEQVRSRAQRMGFAQAPVQLAAETSLRIILEGLKKDAFDLVVIDSIQTMWSDAHEAAPGSVTQVRAAAGELVRLAKKRGVAVILVGHVTKEGAIAGPRVIEHMVDAVLTFEGERGYPFRILRGVKNRFGATDEIGVFEMADMGLIEVVNPSALFLNTEGERAAGAAVFAGIEGSRPVLVEIQALVAPSAYGTPRRAVVGWDSGRLAMVLAVLEARCGLGFGDRDVYLNVAGGLRVTEPAADLAAAAALASSALDVALPQDCVVFGEISLSGDVRQVSRMDGRLKEAAKLGFAQALAPSSAEAGHGMKVHGVARLADAIRRIGDGDWDGRK
ncbi:DNA repair protein RadA [Phenylobacterium sp.]|uniref:DNA repair protein RadA n=1 Tax=Phenylobacterium sp. TaxID=1871053 RepID=UPI0008C5BE05|nr:DNA repair protein RadA [Phenylobacterium sp.]MBA4792845.1 DNA repair protein RadA [Phenylobacterium sp.]MBC7168182.1 DNA repair protein RadA [Phenylobacterium sp.]OHB32583.1 MAG: DNA repair protein RadA [Phenylobacterium sp. RIFCSPHIGHO2_01_FULL_70_10]